MNLRRIYIAVILSGMAMAAMAQEFGCKINFASGEYDGKTEAELIALYSGKMGNDYKAELWEDKKVDLKATFVAAFNAEGQKWHLVTGEYPESQYQINVNVLNLDPDGEVDAEVFAYYQADSLSKDVVTLLDMPLNGDGGKNAVYTKLSTAGFRKLGFRVASELGVAIENVKYEAEREARRQAKAQKLAEKLAEKEARKAAMAALEDSIYAINHPEADKVRITMEEKEVESAEFIKKVSMTRYIEQSQAMTMEVVCRELKEQASQMGANIVYISKVNASGQVLTVRAYCFKK